MADASARALRLPRLSDARGSLSFLETGAHVPFDVGAVSWHAGAPAGAVLAADGPEADRSDAPARFLVALAGAAAGRAGDAAFALERPEQALVVPAGVPLHARAAVAGTALLCLSAAGAADGDGGDDGGAPAFPSVDGAGRVEDCRLVRLPAPAGSEGTRVRVRPGRDVPFGVRRVYYLYDVPDGEARGGHAHRDLQQLIVCVAGAFDLVLDDGRGRRTLRLDRPDTGVYIPRLLWRELLNFAPGTVCMVLASQPYDEADYIREYPEFTACRQA